MLKGNPALGLPYLLVNRALLIAWFSESHVTVQMDDCMGVIDFHPSSDVGVLYLTEADLVGGYSYKGKLLKFAKVF